jgi:hypothetical protein
MLDLIARIREQAPADSILVVEAEEPFNFDLIRGASPAPEFTDEWDVRTYLPAIVGIWHKKVAIPPRSGSVA